MARRLIEAARAERRLGEASRWLLGLPVPDEVVVIGATTDAASDQIRTLAKARGSAFGHHRFTLGRLATELAKVTLADRGLAAVGRLPFEALCARVVDRLRHGGKLKRLMPVVDQPGLPAALARTLDELRQAGATHVDGDPDLTHALEVLVEELAASKLADRALVFQLATEVARGAGTDSPLLGHHVMLIDVPVRTLVEEQLISAFVARARSVIATVPAGDRTTERLAALLGCETERLETPPADSLARVQHHLFAGTAELAPGDDTVAVMSAPGENRECVELARRVMQEAQRGTLFDRMAILLRSPEHYRAHLEEALGRAGIPTHFAQGTRLPDPSGRAFLSLLACAAEELSARRFAEYLSLGELPDATEADQPPPPLPSSERWVPPDEELVPRALAALDEDYEDAWLRAEAYDAAGTGAVAADIAAAVAGAAAGAATDGVADAVADAVRDGVAVPVAGAAAAALPPAPRLDKAVVVGSLRTPWRWERLLHDAAVIGGRERWARRLDGHAERLRLDAHDDELAREHRERDLADLAALRRFALPLIDDLTALPASATWGVWIEHLTALASRTLRDPHRVLAVLANLNPMAQIGPVSLSEVRGVLFERLADLNVRPTGPRYGRLLVTTVEAARGLSFDVVFVPGLAEKLFPQKLIEDPLLLDAARANLGLALPTEHDRVTDERLALRIAVGAATRRVVLSYPRIDLEKGRPRVPSFYGLEVLQAAEGKLPSFEQLGSRADTTGAARIGWPAPKHAADAIDEAEHDLAVLDPLVHNTKAAPKGAARYLLDANPHLARALRARARRWALKVWKPTDGLVIESDAAKAALAEHLPAVRSFSPTALEQLSACPYRFALRTILRLQPREVPEPIESLGALERGSLIHAVQYELLGELRAEGRLPVRAANLEIARDRLDTVLDRVAEQFHDRLAPAIDRVWRDGIASIRADLREWLRQVADDLEWTPRNFELAFGLPGDAGRDPASVDEAIQLDIGIQLRGSIDLVEQHPDGSVRATDYKTGKARVTDAALIAGGGSLQPMLYALALEKILPGIAVAGGRLYYCTTRGDFQVANVPLDVEARESARTLVETLTAHFDAGFFPAAPNKGECRYCDFRPVCGPYEEQRAKTKNPDRLVHLTRLRGMR